MLEKFQKNNSTVSISEKDEIVVFSNAWEDESFDLYIPKTALDFFDDVVLYKEFSAIYYNSIKTFEFIFDFIEKESDLIGRSFMFTFKGNKYRAEYKTPSKVLEIIAKSFVQKNNDSISDYRNIRGLKYYYETMASEDDKKKMLEDYEPISFFIQGESLSSLNINEMIALFKHVNFYMNYYHLTL